MPNKTVIINISDSIPPQNIATIDKNGIVGNVNTKTQIDVKISDLKAELMEAVQSDFKGVISPTDSAPTEDGAYKPETSSKDNIETDPENYGTLYTNAGDLRAKEGYDTMFYKNGSVWKKAESKMPRLEVSSEFDPLTETDPQGGKQIVDFLTENEILGNKSNEVENFESQKITGTWLVGYFSQSSAIGSDFDLISDPALKTLYFDVVGFDRISVLGDFGGDNGIAGFDDNDKLIDFKLNALDINGNVEASLNYRIVEIPPLVKKIAVSVKADTAHEVRKYTQGRTVLNSQILLNEINTLEKSISVEVTDHWTLYENGIVSGIFLLSNPMGTNINSIVDHPDYFTTNTIDTTTNKKIKIDAFLGGDNGVAGFDALGGFNWFVNSSNTGVLDMLTKGLIIEIPDEVKQIRISSRKDNEFNVSIYTTLTKKQKLINASNIVALTNAKKIETESVVCKKPNFARLDLNGILPTDESDARKPTLLGMILSDNDGTVLNCNCKLSIQGHGSVVYAKKGYTIDILNTDLKAVKVKFGDIIFADSFHLKAYNSDRTHTRDVGSVSLWRSMIKSLNYPENVFTNNEVKLNPDDKEAFSNDAKFGSYGFPVAVYLNGVFHGLYTFRLKKTRENYALNNSNKKHIFLDSVSYNAFLDKPFDYTDWELKSPKITGYVPQGDITDTEVKNNCIRICNFLDNLDTQYANHADYIILNHWIHYYILCEIIVNYDISGNNVELLTWDATHWTISPYDMDLTIGLNAWNGYVIDPVVTGLSIDVAFWVTFRTVYQSQITAEYKRLRNLGVLSISNVLKHYENIAAYIPSDIQILDKNKWANIWNNGFPTIDQLKYFLAVRIDELDTIWN